MINLKYNAILDCQGLRTSSEIARSGGRSVLHRGFEGKKLIQKMGERERRVGRWGDRGVRVCRSKIQMVGERETVKKRGGRRRRAGEAGEQLDKE